MSRGDVYPINNRESPRRSQFYPRVRNRSGRQAATVILTRTQRAAGADVAFRTQWAIQLRYDDKIEINSRAEYACVFGGSERVPAKKGETRNGSRVNINFEIPEGTV